LEPISSKLQSSSGNPPLPTDHPDPTSSVTVATLLENIAEHLKNISEASGDLEDTAAAANGTNKKPFSSKLFGLNKEGIKDSNPFSSK
jgi:hypothetical protein